MWWKIYFTDKKNKILGIDKNKNEFNKFELTI